ncbi:MAG TPA: DegQ family serine endoprotease [Xanthobacteraceae bacterium]|jgi:Do/DeqQ family serine protease|nr:DegQ family serine endoprotease [Xanthobacteraceae bacterium]
MPRFSLPAISAVAIALVAGSVPGANAQERVAQERVAQERVVPTSPQQVELSFAPIVKRVAPAVVNVYAQHVVENNNPFLADPFFRQFFGGVQRPQIERSLGSGVIVDPAGLVVTNYHVIEGASEIKVALSDKREFAADVVLKDQRSDLAVLRIKGAKERFPTLPFANSDDLQVGDVVLAIGDPFGVGQTVTHGIVSAVARTDIGISDYQFFIQTDAAINPGNSGGPLVDMRGRMVGLNSAIYSRSGGSQGIGFAIPANMVQVVVASAESGSGAVQRPWLGAKLQEVTPDIADSLGLPRPSGALVANVVADSPAAHGGIKTGDVIVSVDGTEVDDPTAFNYRFATKPLGGTAQLGVVRQGHSIVVPVILQSLPDTPREEVEIRARSPFLGATVANLSPALADEMRLDPSTQGVVVTGVADGSEAQSIGFQKGDVIVSVNDQKIEKPADLQRIAGSGGRQWRITLMRGGQQISVMFSG